MKFNHVLCGGTFDHFHLGHKKFLDECDTHGNKVTVGITTGAVARHKAYSSSMEHYKIRVKNVLQFHPSFIIYKLHDIYGPALIDSSIDAICVTKDTLSGAKMINEQRIKLAMKPLSIILISFAYDENSEKISSERIRQGAINRNGVHYYKYLTSREKFILPEFLKGDLRKPMGHILPSISALSEEYITKIKDTLSTYGSIYCCAVGDMVTFELKKRDIFHFISVIDSTTQRKALNKEILKDIIEIGCSNAKNEKGTIQKEAILELKKLFLKNELGHIGATNQLHIQGEEDLLTLVAVLLAPLGGHVWYGQQGIGAIDVEVTEKMKDTVYNLLKRFE